MKGSENMLIKGEKWQPSQRSVTPALLISDLHSPSPAPRLVGASVRRVVVAAVAPPDVVQVVHGARPHTVAHVAAAPVALLRDAAYGAHGLVAVVHGGQARRL